MIFNPDKVNEVKAQDSESKMKVLKIKMGVMGALGISAVASAATLNAPVFAVASIGMITQLPFVLNNLRYLKNEASTSVPEYRFMLKDKAMAPLYEDQFSKLAIDYVDSSKSLLEKRFKMEFLSEWLQSRDIYAFELKKSGFCEYSMNLKKELVKNGQYEDRPLEGANVDKGVTFGGVCESDKYSSMQRDIFLKDFASEGIVGSLLIKGASQANITEFLSLQDYQLTEKDKQIVFDFLSMSEKDYLSDYKKNKVSSVSITPESLSLVETGVKMGNEDGLNLAEAILAIAKKSERIRLVYVKNNPGKAENPVSSYNNLETDMVILNGVLSEAQNTKANKRKMAV